MRAFGATEPSSGAGGTMVMTTPWTKFRHENALSSFISPTLGATSTAEEWENPTAAKR